ncbi:hypothetical protein ATN84_14975 [Paramesorhizobium deserti]|uniref:Phage holin family protein n=1 Tax=Paramesorhizobium deserti TaxID=1494590 RepID=A0A135HSM4_9HYPH|nr:phage holin family protein [Paramesorhizobium deserti]KXF76200.1 hypothetical protein ATN84_14975 [Paramesorhizobium deserti]
MLRLLVPFLTGAVSGEVTTAIHRTKRRAATMFVIGLLALAGTAFLLVTIYLALARTYGDIWAALIVAAGCFALAIIGLIVMKISDAYYKRRMRERTHVDGSAVLTATALAALPMLAKRPMLIASALPIIGLAVYAFMSEGAAGTREKSRRDSRGGAGR